MLFIITAILAGISAVVYISCVIFLAIKNPKYRYYVYSRKKPYKSLITCIDKWSVGFVRPQDVLLIKLARIVLGFLGLFVSLSVIQAIMSLL